ncbi:linear gramicidin synthetase subunit D domain protein [Mycobacterium xenopi 3993]|nr:linear gramicidin synthetase subunit D domain protein [Mycobacterium xenopi 3993]
MAITHGNVAQLIGSVDAGLAGPGRVWSQWHSYSFDISGWEIFGALLHGAGWWWCRTKWRRHRTSSMRCWSLSRSAS